MCKELIKALEECHTSVWARYFGGCNQIKHDLNMCLRKEVFTFVRIFKLYFSFSQSNLQRIERTKRNGEDAKVRAERRKKALEELHRDD